MIDTASLVCIWHNFCKQLLINYFIKIFLFTAAFSSITISDIQTAGLISTWSAFLHFCLMQKREAQGLYLRSDLPMLSLVVSTAQETLTSWTQLIWDSFSLSYSTPRKVRDGIKSCILQHWARQFFPKPDYFSRPVNEREKQKFRMWARTVSLYTRYLCFQMNAAKIEGQVTFFPTGIMTFQQVVNTQFTSKYYIDDFR